MISTPVVLFIYKRLDTTLRVLNVIKKAKPQTFYLIADGPKSENDKSECNYIRKYIESNVDWPCNFIKIYSDINTGLAKRISTGLDIVFSNEESAIILEDDTLPEISFFRFCENLLNFYQNDNYIGHISGCNHYTHASNSNYSYSISSIINIWGWATWKRAWKHFDINMPSWNEIDQKEFLKIWFNDSLMRKGMAKMFDLHCLNDDPWAWSYQWTYACCSNNLLSIMPRVNLVSNLGIGPGGTNTISNFKVDAYPPIVKGIEKDIIHPEHKRDYEFEKKYYKYSRVPISRKIKNFIKQFI